MARYRYDAMHQLAWVTGLDGVVTYDYDEDGNRRAENRLVAGFPMQTEYAYTFENRLESVKRNDLEVRRYGYQGDSWQRRWAFEDGATTQFLYDGSDVLAEFEGTGALLAHHVTNGIDRTLWTVRGGNLQTPLAGAQNVLAVADAAGQVTARYRYSAFGQRVDLMGGAPNRTDPSFQGRTFDQGLGVYDYRNRSFDPATGRFLQRDPALGGDPTFNPYCFPGNNPVSKIDPMGTDFIKTSGNNVYWVTQSAGRHRLTGPKMWVGSLQGDTVVLGKWFGETGATVSLSDLQTRAHRYLNENKSLYTAKADRIMVAIRAAVSDVVHHGDVGQSNLSIVGGYASTAGGGLKSSGKQAIVAAATIGQAAQNVVIGTANFLVRIPEVPLAAACYGAGWFTGSATPTEIGDFFLDAQCDSPQWVYTVNEELGADVPPRDIQTATTLAEYALPVPQLGKAAMVTQVVTKMGAAKKVVVATEKAAQKAATAERTAAQTMINDIVEKELKEVPLSAHPVYDPALRIYGEAWSVAGRPVTWIGPKAVKAGRGETLATILHEETHQVAPSLTEAEVREIEKRLLRNLSGGGD